MRVEDLFILRNPKSHAVVLHHTRDPQIKQGVTARLIVWDGSNDSHFTCWQQGDAIRLEVGVSSYLIQELPDGTIQVEALNRAGVTLKSDSYPPDQDWYHVLESGVDKVDFPGMFKWAQPTGVEDQS